GVGRGGADGLTMDPRRSSTRARPLRRPHGRCARPRGGRQHDDRGRAGPRGAEPRRGSARGAVPDAVITVAVLAESTRTRARLEALVAARRGWRLIAAPAPDARLEADVLVLEPGARAVEAALRPLARHARLPAILVLGGAA